MEGKPTDLGGKYEDKKDFCCFIGNCNAHADSVFRGYRQYDSG